MAINPTTGFLEWDPSNVPGRLHNVTVRATDSLGAYSDQTYVIDVFNNQPPVIVSGPGAEAFIDHEYIYQIDAEDPEGHQTQFQIAKSQGGSIETGSDGKATFRWNPRPYLIGTDVDIEILAIDELGE